MSVSISSPTMFAIVKRVDKELTRVLTSRIVVVTEEGDIDQFGVEIIAIIGDVFDTYKINEITDTNTDNIKEKRS